MITREVEIVAGKPATANAVLQPDSRPLDRAAEDVTDAEFAASMPRGVRWLWTGLRKDEVPDLPYDSITFESFGCLGSCPIYKMKLTRDGRAEFDAVSHTRQTGRYVGELNLLMFGRLGLLAQRLGLQNFAPRYSARSTEAGGHRITATARNQSWTVDDEGWSGPIELWAVEQVIENIMDRIDWTPE